MKQLVTTGNYNRELQQLITTGNETGNETVNYNRELQQGMKQLITTGNYNRELQQGITRGNELWDFSVCVTIYIAVLYEICIFGAQTRLFYISL